MVASATSDSARSSSPCTVRQRIQQSQGLGTLRFIARAQGRLQLHHGRVEVAHFDVGARKVDHAARFINRRGITLEIIRQRRRRDSRLGRRGCGFHCGHGGCAEARSRTGGSTTRRSTAGVACGAHQHIVEIFGLRARGLDGRQVEGHLLRGFACGRCGGTPAADNDERCNA